MNAGSFRARDLREGMRVAVGDAWPEVERVAWVGNSAPRPRGVRVRGTWVWLRADDRVETMHVPKGEHR